MSTPSTPTRSSPARSANSQTGLTPRRNIDAMLAAIDEQFEREDTSNSPTAALKALRNTKGASIQTSTATITQETGSDSDDEDIPVRRPVGRMAAKMMAVNNESASGESEEERGSAYTRVRKQLVSRKETMKTHENESNSKIDGSDSIESPATGSRHSSPGLFVSSRESSPARTSSKHTGSDSESDVQVNQSRLAELVAHKRAQRKAKEEEIRKKSEKAKKRQPKQQTARNVGGENNVGTAETDSEDEGSAGRRLTQQARPTRKASKKALEDLNRETQRIDRNRQLAHQAKTKKKYTTKDLLAKFNYKPSGDDIATSESLDMALVSSDVDATREHETPPTSPPTQEDASEKEPTITGEPSRAEDNKENANSVPNGEAASDKPPPTNKGKENVEALQHIESNAAIPETIRIRALRAILPPNNMTVRHDNSDSDDDLEIIQEKPSRFPVFDRLPTSTTIESESLRKLKMLAKLTSSPQRKKKDPSSMNATELQIFLQRRAKEQAQLERQEKIKELRAKGIIVRSVEEREKDQLELENLLEKARQEAQALAKKEKKEGDDDGDALLDDDSDDEEYVDGADAEEPEIELSGSEEEEVETDDEGNQLLDEKAEDGSEEEAQEQGDDELNGNMSSDDELDVAPTRKNHSKRNRHVIEDEEDEEPQQKHVTPAAAEGDSIMAAFGFQRSSSPLELTQMFAGTMANMQSQPENENLAMDPEQDSLAFLRDVPVSSRPEMDQDDMLVADSQVSVSHTVGNETQETSQTITLGISQLPSQSQNMSSFTQLSEVPEPTQDAGIELSRSPMGNKIAPHSTIETVIMSAGESPVIKRKGRLRRRDEVAPAFSDVEEEDDVPAVGSEDEDFEISANTFNVMKKAAKKTRVIEAFDKKKSIAKGMVQDQAEESEDEYAGLGGASDDEEGGESEMDEEVQKMIDESEIQVDESKMAAFYADKERAEDEKQIDKLFKDITNGGLRRKRGGEFDLSDSDDDLAERRRRKQREFERGLMRRAMLEDENVGKIASNPKKQAFFRAIEDRDSDSEMDFLDELPEESLSVPDSQVQLENASEQPDAPEMSGANPLKRKATIDKDETRPPPANRRTAAADNSSSRKPLSLAEIRESVSFLIEEPHSIPESQFLSSDSENDSDAEDGVRRRRKAEPASGNRQTIDRLSLARSASMTESTTGTNGNAAFQTVSRSSSFRVPSLLRRATSRLSESQVSTGSGSSSTSTSGSNTPTNSGEGGVRRGGSKKSNIHYQAREAERKRVLDKVEKRRQEGVKKLVGERAGRSVLGMLGGGGFE